MGGVGGGILAGLGWGAVNVGCVPGPQSWFSEKGGTVVPPILVSHLARPPFWQQRDLVADLPYLRVRLQSWGRQRNGQGRTRDFPRVSPGEPRSLAGQPGIYSVWDYIRPEGIFCPASHPSLEGCLSPPCPAL